METVRVLLYCDGSIEHGGQEGIHYNQPPRKCLKLSTGTRFAELVDQVHTVLTIPVQRHIIRLMWRSPTLHQKYVLLPIEDDDDVEHMLTFPSKFSEYRCIELYVLKDDVPEPYSVGHIENVHDSSPIAQHQEHVRTPVDFPMIEGYMPAVQSDDVVNNQCNIDSRGMESDESADDDYWPEHDDSDEESNEDEESYGDVVVHDSGFSSIPAYTHSEPIPTQVHDHQAFAYEQVPKFYNELNLHDGGCVSTPRELPFKSQFWDPSMTEFAKGLLFNTKDELKRACEMYHIKKHRTFNVVESKKLFWSVRCGTSSTGQHCPWRLRATKLKKHGFFEITRYEGPHSCLLSNLTRDNKHITSRVISHAVRHIVEKDPSVNIEAIIATIAEQFHYTVSYSKAWHGKQRALIDIFGEWEPSYAKLPRYMLALQNANPGTVVCWDFYSEASSSERVLNYVFWAFQPSVEGFRYCRPVISIDGTHLYGKYRGKMLIATGIDADNRIFPLAYAIVDEECTASWSWFLLRLRRHVVKDRNGICLISDRHPGILSAIADNEIGWAPPRAYHRYCLRHVCSNFNSRFSNVQLKRAVWKAGSEHQLRKFNFLMERIKTVNAEAWTWLSELEPEKWTLVHDGGFRYGTLTTNLSEVFNSVLRGARNVPITACVQMTFHRLVKYFNTRRAEALRYVQENPNNLFTPHISIKVAEGQAKSNEHRVTRYNMQRATYEVVTRRFSEALRGGGNVQTVSLSDRICSCGKWKIYKYPCTHVLAVCQDIGMDSSAFIDEVYSIRSYITAWGGEFNPVPHEDYWLQTPITCIPDRDRLRPKKRGKPKSTRIRNEMDEVQPRRTSRCSICRQTGHSRRRCPNVTGGPSGS